MREGERERREARQTETEILLDKLFGADATAAAAVPFAFSFFAPSLAPVSRTDGLGRSSGSCRTVAAAASTACKPMALPFVPKALRAVPPVRSGYSKLSYCLLQRLRVNSNSRSFDRRLGTRASGRALCCCCLRRSDFSWL